MKEETKQMGLMKKLTSAIVASSLVFTLVGSASAAYTADAGAQAAARMQALKIVQGMPDGTLGLDKEITRAELVTIIVRAFGQEENAKLLTGSTAGFTDTANHWASGNIAMAKALVDKAGGDAIGMTATTFSPDGKLTPAQAVAFLMKFLGVKADPAKVWPANYLDKAADMGLIAADDKAVIANQASQNATRGLTFYLLDRAFANYNLANGKTFYTTYVDTMAPELTIKNDAVSTTMDSKVTVTGTVTGASELYVGTTKVTPDATGNFSSDVALAEVKADPYMITVTARDIAGNKTEKSIKVTRMVGAAASIEASDITIAAGATADVKAVVKDSKGNVLANQTVTGTATSGTFDKGVYTAGKAVGTDTLVLKVGDITKNVAVTITAGVLDHIDLSAASVAPGTKVMLTAKDAAGNTVSNVTYAQTSADALVDSTSGTFIASKAGSYTVTAKAGDITKTVTVGVFDTTVASYSVTFGSTSLVANGASTVAVTIKALDKFGNVVTNSTAAPNVAVASTATFNYSTDGGTTYNASNFGVNLITLTNGAATVTLKTATGVLGGQTAKVTAGTGTAASSANLNLVDQVATSVSVTNPDTFLASNVTNGAGTTFTVKVLDQDGKAMVGGFVPVTVALNSGVAAQITQTGTTGNMTNLGTPAATATVYYNGTAQLITVQPTYPGATGSVVLTGTATGLTTASDSVTMQFAGQAAKLVLTADSNNATTLIAGMATAPNYKVQVTDAAGVPVAAAVAGATIQFTGLTSTTAPYVKVNGTPIADTTNFRVSLPIDATGKAQFTVNTSNLTGAVSFSVIDTASTGALAASAVMNPSFGAAGVDHYVYTVNTLSKTTVDVQAGSDALTVVAQLQDVNNNSTTNSNASLTLKATAINGGLGSDIVINGTATQATATVDSTGKATFTVKPGAFVGAQYTLTFTGTYVDSNGATQNFATSTLTMNVLNTVASNVTVALYSDAGMTAPVSTVTANTNVYGVATVTDASGRKIANENLTVKYLKADGTWASTGVTPVAGATAGTYTFTLIPTVAPGVTYKVSTGNSVTPASAQFTVGVRPATTAAKLVVVGGSSDQTLPRLTEKALTINLADAYGNAVVNTTAGGTAVQLNFTNHVGGAAANVQVRTATGGLAANSGIGVATVTIPAGAQSVTVYIVTDAAANTAIDLSATAGGLTTGTATFTAQ